MKSFKALLVTAIVFSTTVFAHGEQRPGPHGGQIRMPGAYHTEIVPHGPKDFQVYLLDMKFQNPTTENSSVSFELVQDQTFKGRCEKQKEHFSCHIDKGSLKSNGHLLIHAVRDGKKGNPAKYQTPFVF